MLFLLVILVWLVVWASALLFATMAYGILFIVIAVIALTDLIPDRRPRR